MKILGFKHNIHKTKITLFGLKLTIKHDCVAKVQKNYRKKCRRLSQKFGKEKIKVGFLVTEPAKWQYQSLYEDLEKSDCFEPIVLVTQFMFVHNNTFKSYYKTIDDCYNFFKEKNLRVRYVYDVERKCYEHAKNFDVDILFYQQPWDLAVEQSPMVVSKYALTCYISYGMHLIFYHGCYQENFHQLLYKMFVENEEVISYFEELIKTKVVNCIPVGYSRLDSYSENTNNININTNKPIVIYAPHHSFEAEGIGCATFAQNGREILEMARYYQDKVLWIFKPHPRFKTAVILNKIMTEKEVVDYYAAWMEIGLVYDSGDYIELFKKSSALITDCCSFLGEYLPSKKPVFHLWSNKVHFTKFAKSFLDSYYRIEDMETLKKDFENVIFNGNDYKKKERLSKISLVYDETAKVSDKIMRYLVSEIH